MVTTKKTYRKVQLAIAALFVAFAIASEAAEVSVKLQPNSFPVDRAGQLSITADGNFQRPNPPAPPGVTIEPYGQSRNVQIMNGRMSQTITQKFVISADKPGNYTIPSFEVKVGNERIKTDPVTFTVTATNAPQIGNSQQPSTASAAPQTLGSLRLDFPARDREHLYVGEMAPVRIKAYFPPNTQVSLQSSPRPEGQGFTLHNLSERPEQDFEEINGTRYRTITWFAGISVAKAGEYPITVGLDATVMVPDQKRTKRRRSNPFDSIFGGNSLLNDPFFDDFFDQAFTRTIPREVTLTSPGDPLVIKSLPTEGRPENFSGAVGEFSLGGYKLPVEATTGEPQKIRATVNGKGNFDRLSAPTLEPGDSWKTYKPKTDFTPRDVASFSGSKVFDFNAIPQTGGDQSVSLSFSYFDSKTEEYKTVNSQPIQIAVQGDNVKSNAELAIEDQSAGNQKKTLDPIPQEGETALAPLRSISSRTVSLLPLTHSPTYWVWVGIAALGIFSGFVIRSIRRRHADPERIATRTGLKNEAAAQGQFESAYATGDASSFFSAARKALQERYGRLWNHPAEAITLVEMREKLPPDSPAIQVFTQADELAYAPENERSQVDLKYWKKMLQRSLDAPTD